MQGPETAATAGTQSIIPRFLEPLAIPFRGAAVDWIVVTLLVAVLLPLGLVDILPLDDYPNHLARMHLLAAAGTLDANPFYEVTWRLCPNLAVDLLVPQLARLMSVESALKFFLALVSF